MDGLNDIKLNIVLQVLGLAGVASMEETLSNAFQSANDKLTEQGSRATRVGTIFGGFGRHLSDVERAYDAIFRAGMHLTILGMQLNAIYNAGTGIIKGAITQYSDFQTQLIRTANAIGGITEGTPLWDALAASVEKAAIQLGVYDPKQVAEALYYWEGATGAVIKTNKDMTTQLNAMAPVLEMAYMKNIDMKTAIYGVEGAMRMFHMSTSQTGDVVAIFTSLINKNAFEMGDLINAMKMVGPIAGAMHMSIYQVAEVLAGMADAGIRGGQAGQILRMELLKIEKPSKEASAALDKVFKSTKGLGKAYNDIVFPKGKFEGYTKYIHDLALATQGMTDKQKGHLLATIGTAREVTGLIVAIDNAQRAMKGLGSTTGATSESLNKAKADFAKGWENVTKSWAYLSGVFNDTLKPIIYAIGAAAMQELAPLIQQAAKFGQVLADWVQHNPELVKMIEHIAGIALVVIGVAGAFFTFMGTLLMMGAAIGVVIGGLGGFLLAISGIGAIIALVVAGIATNMGGVRDAAKNLADAMVGFFSTLMGGSTNFKFTFGDALDWLKQKVAEIEPKIAAFFNNIAGLIRKVTGDKNLMDLIRKFGDIALKVLAMWAAFKLFNTIASPFIGVLKDISGAAKVVWQGLKLVWSGLGYVAAAAMFLWKNVLAPVLGWIADVFVAVITGAIGFLWKSVLRPFLGVLLDLAGQAVYAFGFLAGYIGAIVGLPAEAVAAIIAAVAALIAGVVAYLTNFMGFRDKVNQFVADLIGFLQKLVGQAGNFIGQVWQNVLNFFGQVWASIGNFVGGIVKQIVAFGQNFVANIGYYLGFAIGTFAGFAVKFIIGVVNWLGDWGKKIADFLLSLPGKIGPWLAGVVNSFIDWVTLKFIPGIVPALTSFINSVVKFFNDLPNKVVNALKGIGPGAVDFVNSLIKFFNDVPPQILGSLYDIGKQIVYGVFKGINDMIGWVNQQIAGFGQGIIDGFKKALGISSPSKKMAVLGGYLIDGMALGISANNAALLAMERHNQMLQRVAIEGSKQVSASLSGNYVGGPMQFTTQSDKTITVKVDVTSSDGSIDQLKMTDLSNSLQSSELVRQLAHMATVN